MEHRQSEQGGIGVFVIVGVLLTAMLLGGLFLAKQFGKQAHDSAVTTTEQTQQTTTAPETTSSTSESNTSSNTSPQSSTTSQTTPSSTSSTTSTTSSASTATSSTNSSSNVATTGPSNNVPSTGPEDTLAIVAVLSVGIAGVGSYVRSRKHLHATALK